jgi:hypothetical protein
MRSRSFRALISLVALAMVSGGSVATAAAQTSDLSAAITTKAKHPRRGVRVRFIVTITNAGPDPTSGVQITVDFNGGLHGAKLDSAPPDTVTLETGPSCPTIFGGMLPCVPVPTPPKCQIASTHMTCTYDSGSPFLTTTGNDSKVVIAVSAVTGKRRHEHVTASGSSSSADPDPANNTASLTLIVRRS